VSSDDNEASLRDQMVPEAVQALHRLHHLIAAAQAI
jgi:hypothetical protein